MVQLGLLLTFLTSLKGQKGGDVPSMTSIKGKKNAVFVLHESFFAGFRSDRQINRKVPDPNACYKLLVLH